MSEFIQSSPLWIIVVLTAFLGGGFWKFAQWTGKVNTHLDDLKSDIKTVQADIKKILERLPNPKTSESDPRLMQ